MAVVSIAGLCCSLAKAQQGPGDQTPPAAPKFASPAPNAGEKPSGTPKPETPPTEAPPLEPGADPDKPTYTVSGFVLRYAQEHPQHPSIDDLMQAQVTLGQTDDGYVKPGPGVESVTMSVGDFFLQQPRKFTSQALFTVEKAVRDEMNRFGIIGVTVSPVDDEFAPPQPGEPAWGKDKRAGGKTTVTLVVSTGVVKELRTLAFGERIPAAERINNPAHERIRENAPVQPYHPDDPERKDLLRKDLLDAYVFRLNRHPGRRVDLAVSAADDQGGISLDMLINENKPWLVYLQGSNTGTENTNDWRERFGFANNQLTGHDDILSVDYVTAGFTDSNAVNASYDVPIVQDWLRIKPYVQWNNYKASDVGLAGEDFDGEGYTLGGELSANVFQYDELFIDAFVGARFMYVKVKGSEEGDSNFLLPTVGARLERHTDIATTDATLSFEFNLPDLANTDTGDLDKLGRLNSDDQWVTLQWDVTHSFYLEPLLIRQRWEDSGPNGLPILAHEIAVNFRGQYAFDYRLVPNFEQVVGGLYTVRGYPESVVAGDTVVIGSIEYRFHLPQSLAYDPNPGTLFNEPFRWRPQQPYGRADWDLIFKGFVDVGTTVNSHRETFEKDETLVGAGLGVEFQFKRNFTFRVDWGVALEDLNDPGGANVTAGSNRFHLVATILF